MSVIQGTIACNASFKTLNQHHNFFLGQELEDEKALTPTNFQLFMKEQAEDTNKLNEEVQQFKALLQTRKEL